jgi:hypothetical protein
MGEGFRFDGRGIILRRRRSRRPFCIVSGKGSGRYLYAQITSTGRPCDHDCSTCLLILLTVSSGLSAAFLSGLLMSGTASCSNRHRSSLVNPLVSELLMMDDRLDRLPPLRRNAGWGKGRSISLSEVDEVLGDSWRNMADGKGAGARVVIIRFGCLLDDGGRRNCENCELSESAQLGLPPC